MKATIRTYWDETADMGKGAYRAYVDGKPKYNSDTMQNPEAAVEDLLLMLRSHKEPHTREDYVIRHTPRQN